ncbi:MAG TPA: hypothetical protein VM938_03225 [Acidimicrobiales bacterium]|nr:hypothetical protein [Acidimicrobiales bacterium]
MLSLRDTAFALDNPSGSWSLRQSLGVPTWPQPMPSGTVSVRDLAQRFSPAGTALRSLADGSVNLWSHIDRATVVAELRDRLRDPAIIRQNPTGLCGPISIVVEFARRRPVQYVLAAKQLLETGKLVCPTGRVIVAEAELRKEPVASGTIGQVDWLLAATMRDDENIWEDVDDDANGLETITLWGEERGWTRDVLDLPNGGWETCFVEGEVRCMRKAQDAVNAGGVAFFLIDANLIKNGGDDDEEPIHYRSSGHGARQAPSGFGGWVHSKDDDYPPDHWVIYLGGLNLGADPDDDDPVLFRVWSWGSEFELSGTVDAFSEYLYGVVTGTP